MEQRLAGTLTAVKTVEPALTKFYDLLNDEQKARRARSIGRKAYARSRNLAGPSP